MSITVNRDELIEELMDYRRRFIFQGGSPYARAVADLLRHSPEEYQPSELATWRVGAVVEINPDTPQTTTQSPSEAEPPPWG